MSGPKRNPDKLNTIGIVVVGICGAVLVYVTIVALQAFYVNDTSEVQNSADYGNQDMPSKALKADQMRNITETGVNPGPAGTYRVPVDRGMQLVVESAKSGDGMYVPKYGVANQRTALPIPGRGHPDDAAAKGSGAGSGGGSAAGSGATAGSAEAPMQGSGAMLGSGATGGSAAPPTDVNAPSGGHAR